MSIIFTHSCSMFIRSGPLCSLTDPRSHISNLITFISVHPHRKGNIIIESRTELYSAIPVVINRRLLRSRLQLSYCWCCQDYSLLLSHLHCLLMMDQHVHKTYHLLCWVLLIGINKFLHLTEDNPLHMKELTHT